MYLYFAGITAELFYVRKGIINDYALNFRLPIPKEIDDLYFTWQSIKGQREPHKNDKVIFNNPCYS